MASGKPPGLGENPDVHKHLVILKQMSTQAGNCQLSTRSKPGSPQSGLPLPSENSEEGGVFGEQRKGWEWGWCGEPGGLIRSSLGNETLWRPARISGWSPGH